VSLKEEQACGETLLPEREIVKLERGPLHDYSSEAAYVVETVEAVHPIFVMEGFLPDNYNTFKAEYLDAASVPMSRTDFVLATQHYFTILLDGHMGLGLLERIGDKKRFIRDGGYVTAPFVARNSRLFLAKDPQVEVLKIGGVAVGDVFAQIDRYYFYENESARMLAYAKHVGYQLMLDLAGAEIYRRNQEIVTDLSILNAGKLSTMVVTFRDADYTDIFPSFTADYIIRWEMKGDVFYIDLRRFRADPGIEACVQAIEAAIGKGVRKFIVDLRGNPGGSNMEGFKLLMAMGLTVPEYGFFVRGNETAVQRSLWPELGVSYSAPDASSALNPNKVFISVLTDAESFSSATDFAVWVADGKFGNVIGEPSSNAPSSFGDMLEFPLQKSGILINISYKRFLRPDANADQDTLHPDILVDPKHALEVALEYLKDL